MPKIIHCILHNLFHDQRLHRIALTLSEKYEVEVVGINRGKESPLPQRPYRMHRLFIPIRRGPLFFLIGNFRFFWFLLWRRWDGVIAYDLAALPGCWLAAFLRRKPILLDSRELFTQTPFLVHRPLVRRIWELAERLLYPRVAYIITVSPPIARYYQQRYRKPTWLVYNLPPRAQTLNEPSLSRKLLLYQGMLHPYRGLEEVIAAMAYAEGWSLWVLGDGPLRPKLEQLIQRYNLQERVRLWGMVSPEELPSYTKQATFGISGELPHGLNHTYAMPNKFFDYLQQGIPVLVGEAPLLQKLVRYYRCGAIVSPWHPEHIAKFLQNSDLLNTEYGVWVENARKAASLFHWDTQKGCLLRWVEYALERKSLPPQQEEVACRVVSEIARVLEG
ncbi:MAG: glycosyltransferase [Bacteroidia bacterium]|nr:glycosyltransferase [Bacteroidia bacterium]MDW8235345.1 glycosyltransferase [Bacteroidia bacterium]